MSLTEIIDSSTVDESFFNKLGHEFYVKFIHDYNIGSCLMACSLIKDFVEKGKHDKALDMIDNLMCILSDTSKKVDDIKELVRGIHKKEKVDLNFNDYFQKNWGRLVGYDRASKCDLTLKLSKNDFSINISTSDINTIISNLLINSFDAMSDHDKKLTIETRIIKDQGELIINDNGSGISFAKNGNVPLTCFAPGKTTKVNGTGYGMISVIEKIEENGWKIQINNIQGNGCTYKLSFPIKNIL